MQRLTQDLNLIKREQERPCRPGGFPMRPNLRMQFIGFEVFGQLMRLACWAF